VESISWEETLEVCRKVFSENAGVLFFPEGHRSRTGHIQQFQSGAFRLAIETGIPVVPLCITGTDTLLPPGHYRLHPANIRLKALPPIDPTAFTGSFPHIKMRRYVHSLMAGEIGRMREETC
jgi:1-acyl-sn-glycerol-3-phosphate acyltransferase